MGVAVILTLYIYIESDIILAIAFHSCGYEDIFTKIHSHLGVKISESFYLHMHIIDTRRQYKSVYNDNTHVKNLR